jgi:hypothetical protein
MAEGNGVAVLGEQIGSAGRMVGAKLLSPLFVPAGMGSIVFQDSNGAWWMQRLVQNADGTTWFDENGRPATELVQVAI